MGRDGRSPGAAVGPTPFRGGEMTVPDLLAAVRQTCVGVGEASTRSAVAAVGIAGMAESGAPLDFEGHPQAPIIAWHDSRGFDVVERLRRQFEPDLDRWIGQRLRTVSSVAKLGWLVEQGVGPVDRWLGVPELVFFALTGRQATEFSLAARTGAYDVGARRYLPRVIAALRAAPGVFPPVEGAGRPMGRISAAGAAWSGLPVGIPVTLAGHDHLVGMVGSGAGPEDLVNSVGTAEMIVAGGRPLPDLDRALSLRVAVTLMPRGEGWALLASAARSGIVLAAVAEALGASAPDLDALVAALPAGTGAGAGGGAAVGGAGAGAAVGGAGAGAGGGAAAVGGAVVDTVVACRGDAGRASGRAGGGAVTAVAGEALIAAAVSGQPILLPSAAPGEVWRAVLDALVARTWDAVDRVIDVGGPAIPERLVVFGGGSASQPWMQAKAAARPGTPVWRSTATEAVARGAALYAGVAAGWWASPAAGPHTALDRVVTTP